MSFLYKLDARTKLFGIFLITLLIFVIDRLTAALGLVLILIIMRLITKIYFHELKFFTKISLLAVFVILVQTLFGPGDTYIVKPLFPPSFPVFGGAGSLKLEGFMLGLVIVCRLFALMLILPVFTKTTPCSRIAEGLCAMGINYRIAFIITTAFNLIPFFKEEALSLIDAQKLRGMCTFDRKKGFSGSFFSSFKVYTSLLIPLMLGAMRKAQVSSVAMDSRAFGIYRTRTWTDRQKMKGRDFIFLAACIIFTACVLCINWRWIF